MKTPAAICWLLLALTPCVTADSGAERQFRVSCGPCHGTHGEGGRGPALAVAKLPRAPDDVTLSAIISAGIPGTQMPGTRMTADERQQLVNYVRSLGKTLPQAADGDRSAGERIFWAKGNCGHCHTVGARGGRIGPDLTSVGLTRGPDHLRAALLDPASAIPDSFTVYRRVVFMPDNFLQVRLMTRDGRSLTGLRVDEDAFTIQIRDYSDRIYSFRKDELRQIVKDWGKTPMPAYGETLSAGEIRDVVAYLSSLRGAE
jgi:putative heme-binding domain-containing protein